MKLVGLGAGGHAKVVIEIVRLLQQYELVGLLDVNRELWGAHVLGVPVVGDDGMLPIMYDQGICDVFIGLGSVGDSWPRKRLYEKASSFGFRIIQAIHPNAIVSPSVEIGQGATIMAGVVINASARLGDNVIVNTGALVEHDCIVGDHVHIASGARLASTVRIGDCAHIGAGATVRQCISIGEGAIVGAGAVVVKDVPPRAVVAGVPAQVLKT